MTEGSIASWRIKEGDSFSAGDVILEIETDKATMDVEAQDDGILVKITKGDGSKGVQVGERIGILAEAGDDISSLELPAEDKKPAKEEKTAKQEKPAAKEGSKAESAPTAAKSSEPQKASKSNGSQKQGGAARKQTYPLYPSVEHLLHVNGLTAEDADQIPATGPQGRLLKGDVLAYLGQVKKDYPASVSARLDKLSHLDLSNIQLAKKAEAKPETKAEQKAEPESPKATEIAIPISLSAVIATQKRVQETLGIFLPLSTFIARASELANDNLPFGKNRKATADDLFNSVLGLDQVARSSRGNYFPNITGISTASLSATPPRPSKKVDIIDILAPKSKAPKRAAPVLPGISPSENIFSVVAPTGEERRATEYLEKMKLVLEDEPGRLVL
jgi:pyruvate/2-oxoglutarate dehydrogenase complex dihydrolipoamide acyltransferase (E2) component